MNKKLNYISVFSIFWIIGFLLENYLLLIKQPFVVPLSFFVELLTVFILISFIYEYIKTKNKMLLWTGILMFAILFKETTLNLIKALTQ